MAVEWIGKFTTTASGNVEPLAWIVDIPCRDIDDGELRAIAKAHGTRRDALERSLVKSGLFRMGAESKPDEPDEEPEPADDDEGGVGFDAPITDISPDGEPQED